MHFLPEHETAAAAAVGGQHEQVEPTLHPAESRMAPSNGPMGSNTSFPAGPDVMNSMPNWSGMPGRVTDPYQSSSNRSTPLSGEFKSPPSIRNAADAEYGSHGMPIKRSDSNDQFFTDSSVTFDGNRMSQTSSSTPQYASLQRQSSSGGPFKASPHQSSFSESRTGRPSFSAPTSAGNFRNANPNYTEALVPNGMNYPQNPNGFMSDSYPSQPSFPPSMSLPPPAYQPMPQASPQNPQVIIPNAQGHLPPTDGTTSINPYSTNGMDSVYSMPSFEDGQSRSPFAMADDFTAWLFNEPYPQSSSPGGHRPGSMSVGTSAFADDPRGQFGSNDPTLNGQMGSNVPPQHPMAVNSILDPASLHADLSEEKWKDMIEFIETHFTDSSLRDKRTMLLSGDQNSDSHALSLRAMQNYIGSYWYHFHPQMPILHKPTFSTEKAPNLLLFAIICLGASCLDKMHGQEVTQAGAELSSFLAWHLRGEIFKDRDFLPPAKLWVFQTLLLLEIYEKMYSDRKLHERAHIHHATTLTLMRRGSSLIGRSALDSPPLIKSEKTPADQLAPTPKNAEEWWDRWITNEATRRVAFAAFIIDSIHATMFGHSATMVAHEMKLALPCDESLWMATSSAEVARIEHKLHAQGNKTMTFFEGLKDTLKNKQVRTNSFGRTAIMAGLLSVTWHMNQRDVQIHHLGALKALGGKDIWRAPLTRAFDLWKRDFDQSVDIDNMNAPYPTTKLDGEYIFESRTVLHHLAHMAMHVDVVSCQIFARATRLLGRLTLPSDYEIAQKRIRQNWAPKATARLATFYALKFLKQVLVTESIPAYPGGQVRFSTYSARDDFLLNRPWVLYYAVLIVWSYGYALDGPLDSPPLLITPESKHADMVKFLTRVGGITDPRELERTNNRNDCLGLLHVLQEKFKECRWELLQEAAQLLNNCIDMLRGKP